MTPQEAIQRIKQHNEIHSKKERFAIYITEALNMAVEALEKQIPKKYIREKTDFFSFPVIKCPNCTGIIGKVEFLENCELVICPRGCPCCGQAIDNRSDNNGE